MSRFLAKVIFTLIFVFEAKAQLTIVVNKIPENTPVTSNIYLAGTMNNWNPGNVLYVLNKDSLGTYRFTFTPPLGIVKFKFTRGSWDTVEGTEQGGFIADRSITYSGQPITNYLSIAGWEGSSNVASTASPQVQILSTDFFIPQLNRNRKIWLYLPKDYATSEKKYPVLYMQDGQNIFDKKTSFSGEWRVDESLDSMFVAGDYGCIIVGIENGGASRLNEYSPWYNTQYGGGEGDEYISFIVETLKPYIDENYRTLKESDNTGIMGSSMGGLVSMYAGIAYPNVFGKVGAFSSSYWFSNQSYEQISDTGVDDASYFYMIAGALEGGKQVEDMNKMSSLIKTNGGDDKHVQVVAHSDGKHNEWYWAREFPKAYKWMFEKKTSLTNDGATPKWKIYYDGVYLQFISDEDLNGSMVEVLDLNGKRLSLSQIMENKAALHISRGCPEFCV
ncbi:MAG: alpha/beta hydrolase [Saprospiraceae bacterium]|nr:alpha/beta hydrolase [Saprospiraceae bacterium]